MWEFNINCPPFIEGKRENTWIWHEFSSCYQEQCNSFTRVSSHRGGCEITMTEKLEKPSKIQDGSMKIAVGRNGPHFVTGGIPLISAEICKDEEGYCRTWREVKRYPLRGRYALCRCGHSENKPFCDGTHAKIRFDGTEAGDNDPHSEGANVIRGPVLTLTDNKHTLCPRGILHTGRRNMEPCPKIRKPGSSRHCYWRSVQLPVRSAGDLWQRHRGSNWAWIREINCLSRVSFPWRARSSLGSRRHPDRIIRRQAVRDQKPSHTLPVREIEE